MGPVLEKELHSAAGFFEAHDAMIEPDDILIELSRLGGEQLVKIGAVKLIRSCSSASGN